MTSLTDLKGHDMRNKFFLDLLTYTKSLYH